jgi:hypothetical protein
MVGLLQSSHARHQALLQVGGKLGGRASLAQGIEAGGGFEQRRQLGVRLRLLVRDRHDRAALEARRQEPIQRLVWLHGLLPFALPARSTQVIL